MKTKLMAMSAGVAMVGGVGIANAADPLKLTNAQMDKITAGYVILYNHHNLDPSAGRTVIYPHQQADKSDLRRRNFNDVVTSMKIVEGTWTFYRHINFQEPYRRRDGSVITLGPGIYTDVRDWGIANDDISSLGMPR